jgi:hypothetical protein
MRFPAKGALLLLLLCLEAIPGLAQEKEKQKPIRYRPLTLSEGSAIVDAALDFRRPGRGPSDCSHFVLGLYERAGFPYRYANSSELYAGIDEFQRVAIPQQGDLAVWRGHAGIVINPVQHTFFSLLRSGPRVGSYDSPYWQRRGRPHFFRYLKAAPGGVLSSSIRTASLKPTILDTPESGAEDSMPDASGEPSNETRASTKVEQNPSVNPTFPPVTIVNAVRPKPDQVGAAFLQACAESEKNLRGRDFFKSAQPLIVFDHFKVRKVHLAGDQDWAEVQIDELVSLTGSKAEMGKRSERQRWLLSRRDNTTWELTPSRDTIYLPQPIAVRILAHELAQLTDDSPSPGSRTEEKATLARLLDSLLENNRP